MWSQASTSDVVWRSMISIAAGTIPLAIALETVRQACSMVTKSNSMVFTASGFGSRRTQISVTIASVPSLPMTSEARSKSGASGASPPSVTVAPS